MRIAFIGQRGLPAVGPGPERHVEALATALAAAGHSVTVYARAAYTHPRIKSYRGVLIRHVPALAGLLADRSQHAFAVLHALFVPYDAVYLQPETGRFLTLCLRLLKRRTVSVLGFPSSEQPPAEAAPLLLSPHLVVVPRESQAEFIRDYYGVEAVAIPEGTPSGRTARADRLQTFNLKEGSYLVAGSAASPASGAHWLIKAFLQLEDTSRVPNNFKLVLLGSSETDPEYARFLRLLAEGRDSVVFAGEVRGETLHQLLSHALLAVVPGRDGQSLETLRLGLGHFLPMLALQHDRTREIARDAAEYVDPKSAESLQQELSYLINNGEERARLSEAARCRVRTSLSWKAVAARLAEACEDVRTRRSNTLPSTLRHGI